MLSDGRRWSILQQENNHLSSHVSWWGSFDFELCLEQIGDWSRLQGVDESLNPANWVVYNYSLTWNLGININPPQHHREPKFLPNMWALMKQFSKHTDAQTLDTKGTHVCLMLHVRRQIQREYWTPSASARIWSGQQRNFTVQKRKKNCHSKFQNKEAMYDLKTPL